MKRSEIRERFAEMWQQARYDAGLSQAEAAELMHVSKNTIQNWEYGASAPGQMQGFEYFRALGVQPLPYYLRLLYPETADISSASEGDLNDLLLNIMSELSDGMKHRLVYILSGLHGSSVPAVLELISVYLSLPLKSRIMVTDSILRKYDLDKMTGDLIISDTVAPDVDLINKAVERASSSVRDGRTSYTSLPETEEE